MAETLFALTEDERDLVQEVITLLRGKNLLEGDRSRPSTTSSSWRNEDAVQAPEVYITKPPPNGIPARDGDEPGKAECDVFRLEDEPGSSPLLVKIQEKKQDVYNLDGSPVSESYVIAWREKYGKFLSQAGSLIRLGEITGICDSDTGTGTDTSGDQYEVDLYDNSSLPELTCGTVVTEFQEEICCDIIDDDTGDYLDCQGFETTGYTGTGEDPNVTTGTSDDNVNTRGECVDFLGAPSIDGSSAGTGSGVETITVQDLSGRQLPIGTVVAVAKIGEMWVIVEAGLSHSKVCVLSDVECAVDCDGNNVLLRTFRPLWIPTWAVCPEQAEFIPDCPSTGTA